MYDFWYVINKIEKIDIGNIITIFEHYMQQNNAQISRAEFEKNLFDKIKDVVFNQDIKPLLSAKQAYQYQVEEAFKIILEQFCIKLRGEAWQGTNL